MKKAFIIGLLSGALSTPSFAAITFLSAPLGPGSLVDTVSWLQLGSNGSAVPEPFSATGVNGLAVTGHFASLGGGLTCEVDAPGPSAPCSWIPAPGFTTGETLIWAEDAFFSGSGPLTVTFLAQFGGGAYIQSTGDLQYTARLKAFNGASLLGVNTITSNAQGDPVFLGVVDSTQEITGLEFSLTNCTSTSGFCDATDFAVGTLSIYNATPEPSSMLLALGGLVALGLARRKN